MYDRDRPVLSPDHNPNVTVMDLYGHMEGSLRTDNSYAQWLTDGHWDKDKYTMYLFLKQLPVIGQYTNFLTDYYDDMSYMDRNQITWDDVNRPWKLKSSNSGPSFIRSGFNFVSDNVKRLYK